MSRAADITLGGSFTADDNVQLFNLTVASAGSVDLRSYGYAGGLIQNDAGIDAVLPGGFDTILTLFDASGNFISENDDGAGVATDPTTGLAGDARLTQTLTPGSYILVLTEYDNFSGGNLADGFVESGTPNFTANPNFTTGGPCPGNLFRDISGTAGRCRNGNWTVNFANVASVTPVAPVPEPSAVLLAGVGLALLLVGYGRRRRKTATLLAGGLMAALASVPVEAQTNCPQVTSGPDYCHVSDFLNGQRNLLNVTDLSVVYLDPSDGPNYTLITTSNSQQTVATSFQYGLQGIDSSKPILEFSAHMFNQTSASTITTLHNYDGYFALWLQNIASNGGTSAWTPLALGDDPGVSCGVVADFTQDGFDDLALGLADGRILVVSPNSTDPLAQPYSGSFHSTNPITTLNLLLAMAAGDFNGDGRKELAGLTVVPYDQPGGGSLVLVIYTVDPQSLAVTTISKLPLTMPSNVNGSNPITRASIARGKFNTLAHDQLAVAFATNSGPTIVEVIDFTPNPLTPVEKLPALTASTVSIPIGYLQIQTGQFGLAANPSNPYDQVVFHLSSGSDNGRFFEVLLADPTSLTLTAHSGVTYNQVPCAAANGVQVGNFDHRQSNQAGHDPDSQIAFMFCNGNATAYGLNIYNVNPSTFDIVQPPVSSLSVPASFVPTQGQGATFVATDLQGRSLTLGAPTKITIDSAISPSVIVSAPPMHVDFVSPSPLTGAAPEVLNISAVPDAFNTTYDQETSSGTTTSTTNKTSWSFGATESVNAFVQVGDPDEGEGLKASDTLTAAQNLKGASENTHGTFQQNGFHLTTTTGLADQIVYTDSQFNIWVYPVIGKTVCPASNPKCSQKSPLTIQFSASNGNAQPITSPGASLPWYQPPWEPGNLFSYPANAAQLKAIYPNLTSLTNAVTFASTSGGVTEQATWSNQSQDSSSASFDQDYSFDNNFSVNGAFEFAGIGAGGGYGLDLSGSYGLSTLSQTSNQIASSTGLKIQVPGTVANFKNYGYLVSPSIMGTAAGPNVVDSPPNTSDKSSVQTYGRLVALYTVDPLNSNQGAGAWWRQAYTSAPDVALNHPARWTFTATSLVGAPPSNCLAIGGQSSQYDCVTLNTPTPSDPLGDDFHVMRGFFISHANAQNQNFQNQGPQLELAKAGDVLNLSARVYNYSLYNPANGWPAGTQVHARFYYMLWDTTRAQPVDPQGASTLINEVTTAPIPAFDTSSDQPNWTLVGTQFNTGDATNFPNIHDGNVSLVFWVMVWMQDGQGNLINDLPNHGLTKVPPAFASWVDAANFECPSATSCYSNNLGIYPGTFYIASSGLGSPPSPLPVSASVDIGKLDVSASRVGLADKVTVSATVSAEGADGGTMSVNFYQGDPKQAGQLFAVQRIPHIAQSSGYKITASYRPNSCGTHELFAVINQGQPNEIVRRAPPVRVDCSQSMLRRPVDRTGQRLNLK
jgi:hypothetical protein